MWLLSPAGALVAMRFTSKTGLPEVKGGCTHSDRVGYSQIGVWRSLWCRKTAGLAKLAHKNKHKIPNIQIYINQTYRVTTFN